MIPDMTVCKDKSNVLFCCFCFRRGLNPPHRVKSISMSSFTPEEMEFLMSRGNDLCRRVWLGLYDNRSHLDLDSKDENKIKDFMAQKYEKKRYYVAPTETMYAECRKQNSTAAETTTKKSSIANLSMNRHKTQVSAQQSRDLSNFFFNAHFGFAIFGQNKSEVTDLKVVHMKICAVC